MAANSTTVEVESSTVEFVAASTLVYRAGMALGSRVRELRLERGWTLEELSERSGVDVGTISALEMRDSKRSQFATDLAKALGVSTDQLLSGAYGKASTSAEPIRVSEPPPSRLARHSTHTGWPFPSIDQRRVARLSEAHRAQLEGALLLTAAQLGLDIRKRAAA